MPRVPNPGALLPEREDMDGQERNARLSQALIGLRSLVLGGAFPAGSRLPETALSERLGLSRTPLRQAMDRLVDEGLLERGETGGVRVATFTMSDILDAIELRGVLEGTAARLAAERGADPALAEEMAGVLDEIDEALAEPFDFAAYVRLNDQFHDLLSRLAGSPIVQREVARANRLPAASPTAFLRGQELIPDFRTSLTRAQHQHRSMAEAIAAREGARAEALAREHARLARANLEHVLGTPGLATQVPGLALISDI